MAGIFIPLSRRVVNINELVQQTKLVRYMRSKCWRTIAFARVMAASQISDTTFPGEMRLWFGNFTGEERIRTSGDSCLEIALSAATAPCYIFYSFIRPIYLGYRPI
jgi:hypothetical protein